MKKLILLGVLSIVCFMAVGCASVPANGLLGPGSYYSDTVTVGAKRGEATGQVWLGLFGKESYPTVERVATENGIAKIATVEHYSKLGIFGLWTSYTTIVTGE